jgi:hypothetical protein
MDYLIRKIEGMRAKSALHSQNSANALFGERIKISAATAIKLHSSQK